MRGGPGSDPPLAGRLPCRSFEAMVGELLEFAGGELARRVALDRDAYNPDRLQRLALSVHQPCSVQTAC
ncbi:hypothetical protein Scel_00630 [Streptomyces cellostaticus]|nr:hypothetical protein Scel_00630 [Streptomyces cellostaticus]